MVILFTTRSISGYTEMSRVSAKMETGFSTRLVRLANMKSAPSDLIRWLDQNMKNHNWGVRETARRAGLSHPTVSDILNGIQPSEKTCKALAKLFRTSPEVVLRMAGHLPPLLDTDPLTEEGIGVLTGLEGEHLKRAVKLLHLIADEQGEYRVQKGKRTSTSS